MKQIIITTLLALATVVHAKNHIAFVNVGNAIDGVLLKQTVANDLDKIICINAAVDTAESIDIGTLVAEASKGYPSGERKISVYFVNDAKFPPQITVHGFFAVINVRGLNKGADAKAYARRLFKMVLKGLAFSCGFGANHDIGRCVMGAGSFDSLKGIDGTSASYSPFCYMPLSEYLRSRGLLVDVIPTFD